MKNDVNFRRGVSLFYIILLIILVGCSKLKGEFAFKNIFDDTYQSIDKIPEFNKKDEVNWIYIFDKISSTHEFHVVLLKKEIVWVDLKMTLNKINLSQKIIYGKIQDFNEGRYRILICEKGKVIDEKEFLIYEEEDSL